MARAGEVLGSDDFPSVEAILSVAEYANRIFEGH